MGIKESRYARQTVMTSVRLVAWSSGVAEGDFDQEGKTRFMIA